MMTQEEARDRLREMLKPGDTVHTIVRHVSASGMTRWIDCYAISNRGELIYLTALTAWALGTDANRGKHDGIKREGCGMDMGFDLVYNLGRALWPDGFRCAGKRCPSNDHVNPRHDPETGERIASPYPRDGRMRHRGDGGYALNQRWI